MDTSQLETSTELRELSPSEFRDVIGHFASGVTVITVDVQGEGYGTTASAVSSLSLEPPMVLICMNKTSTTGHAVAVAKAFAMNILTEDQSELARHFAVKGPDKFRDVPVTRGRHGQLLLADALATLECDVVEEVAGGTHTVFLAVVRTATSRDGSPLAYFRGQFGRLELPQDDHVYATLRERLLARTLPVGRSLEIDEISDSMHVPTSTLYYALGRLSMEGMLARGEDGGFIVPPITCDIVKRAVDACCAMELGAIELAGDAAEDDLAELRASMEASYEHLQPGRFIDMDESMRANSRFHEAIVGLAQSDQLLVAYRRVALPGIIVRTLEPRIASESTDLIFGQDHRDIVEALERGNVAAARAAVITHAEHVKRGCRETLAATGGEL